MTPEVRSPRSATTHRLQTATRGVEGGRSIMDFHLVDEEAGESTPSGVCIRDSC
ncbi:hypothetical protein [Streptomyces resistomycificus]|uniref:hypothetical protein n=1 Tax=Streptomyces resistomycificus TaxID=67356 RepID=UPI000A9E4EB0|nr:hypothetical protein [Streptomyces resistomycificus]